MIELKNVSKFYHNSGVVALGLHEVSLTLSQDEIVGIVGESGSGKSTLLNVICGMDGYDEGEILFQGQETSYFDQQDMDEFRKKNVAFINQNYNILDSYSVLENVALPLFINGMDEKTATEKAKELIERVHLTHRINSKGSQLSGGEKQRCVIARALAKDTPILACDEPTGNLDSQSGEEIISLIKEVSQGKLVLLVTHNEEQANPILTRKIRLKDGEVVEDINMKEKENVSEPPVSSQEIKKNKSLPFQLALKNLKNTPRKNIFSTIILTVFSFIMIYFYLLSSSFTFTAGYNNDSNYCNTVKERLVVYDKDHSALDTQSLESISGTKYKNAFYEDFLPALTVLNSNGGGLYSVGVTMSLQMPKNATLLSQEEKSSSETNFTLLVPDKDNSAFSLNSAGTSFTLSAYTKQKKVFCYQFGCCEDLTYPLMVFENETDLSPFASDYLCSSYYGSSLSFQDGSSLSADDLNIYVSSASGTSFSQNTLIHYASQDTLSAPKELGLTLNNIYPVSVSDFDYKFIEMKDSNADYYEFDLFSAILPEETYEETIYCDNLNQAIKTIESLNYSYVIPSHTTTTDTIYTRLVHVIIGFLYGIVTIVGLILTFVTYFILSRIYLTKQKEMAILRQLGVTKPDLRKSVISELAMLTLFSSGLSLLLFWVLSFFVPHFQVLFSYFNAWVFILFLLVMQLLSLIISLRFNKKLFKLTVTDSLKEEKR